MALGQEKAFATSLQGLKRGYNIGMTKKKPQKPQPPLDDADDADDALDDSDKIYLEKEECDHVLDFGLEAVEEPGEEEEKEWAAALDEEGFIDEEEWEQDWKEN